MAPPIYGDTIGGIASMSVTVVDCALGCLVLMGYTPGMELGEWNATALDVFVWYGQSCGGKYRVCIVVHAYNPCIGVYSCLFWGYDHCRGQSDLYGIDYSHEIGDV